MSLSSSDFVTNDSARTRGDVFDARSEEEEGARSSLETGPITTPHLKDNIKGVQKAGWLLAVLFPFVGVFLNVWLLRNGDKRGNVNKVSTVFALIVSSLLSAGLLIAMFVVLFNFWLTGQ